MGINLPAVEHVWGICLAVLGAAEKNGRRLIAPKLSLTCLQPRQVSYGLTMAGGSRAALLSFIKEGEGSACGLGPAGKELQLQSLATSFMAGKESLASRVSKGARDHAAFHSNHGLEKLESWSQKKRHQGLLCTDKY